MDHGVSAAHRAGKAAVANLQRAHEHVAKVVSEAHAKGYFEAICTDRHLSVRHYTWDAFAWVGDIMHCVALVICIAVVLRESGTDGVSFKTHLLFFIVFSARFLNVFFCEQSIFLVLYKVLLWTGTLKVVILMWALGSREDKRDTMPLFVVLVPPAVVALVFGVYSVEDHGLIVELLWIFSMYLESVAMLPQYIYCYRDMDNRCPIVSAYVFVMGGYRMVFGLSWAYHYLVMPYYLDMSSLISGVLGIVFFCDYLLFKVANRSTLSQLCISVDDTIREAEHAAQDMLSGQPLGTRPLMNSTNTVAGEKVGKPIDEIELSSEVAFHH